MTRARSTCLEVTISRGSICNNDHERGTSVEFHSVYDCENSKSTDICRVATASLESIADRWAGVLKCAAGVPDRDREKLKSVAGALDHDREKLKSVAGALDHDREKLKSVPGALDRDREKLKSVAGALDRDREKLKSVAGALDRDREKLKSVPGAIDRDRETLKSVAEARDRQQPEKNHNCLLGRTHHGADNPANQPHIVTDRPGRSVVRPARSRSNNVHSQSPSSPCRDRHLPAVQLLAGGSATRSGAWFFTFGKLGITNYRVLPINFRRSYCSRFRTLHLFATIRSSSACTTGILPAFSPIEK